VIGGLQPGQKTLVRLIDSQANQQERKLEADGSFAFTGLSAGLYAVEVVGQPASAGQQEIALDGQNQVTVELIIPVTSATAHSMLDARQSVISGMVPHAAGQVARLADTLGNEWTQVVRHDDHFCFGELPAGSYTLTIDSGYSQADLKVDGANGLEVEFAELIPLWVAEVAHAGSMPGYSVVRVEVEGLADIPVHIWKEDWEGMMRRTGSKPDYGSYALEFSPLGPGHYMVEPESLGVWSDVTLTGLEAMWVHFRRRRAPATPNIVRPYVTPSSQPAATTPVAEETVDQTGGYLFIGSPPSNAEDLIALLHFAAQAQPQVGNSVEEALKAKYVLLIGADGEANANAESVLRAALVPVERISHDLAKVIQQRLSSR
jgi:hypothetical protein